ncbi:MAG: hypothetical protein PHD81_00950 [Candidatus Nanoarchaeia archaeon]|nr:hypothetical protein [Candidatus Nanoarchaeia archaeon]MDD5587658.1 hypothetical protein [Candidatus Nanoarchaeia archaeon]
MKKAQTEQIFVFIFAMVVIAALIFLGLKLIKSTTCTADRVELANAMTNINKYINIAYNMAPGSVIQRQLAIPKSLKFFCFIDPENPDYEKIKDTTVKNIIQSRIEAGDKSNFYWQMGGKCPAQPLQKTYDKLKISKTLYLTPDSGTITIKLENKGDNVDIYL